MLDKMLASIANWSDITITTATAVTLSTIILGLLISFVYMKTNRKRGYSPQFATALIMLPVIIAIIILLVGNNVARAFSLAGAFSIIRFRSVPGEPRDITYVLFTLAIGLACGMGYIGYGVIFAIVLSVLMIILEVIKFTSYKSNNMQLKIMVPEDLNYEEIFDEILNKYSNSWRLENIRTKEFGSVFELTYAINLPEGSNKKNFIDDLRCRNGNLKISLTLSSFEEKAFD